MNTTQTTFVDLDYSQFVFQSERCNYHTDFKSELTWLKSRDKTEHVVDLSNVSVDTDGSISISSVKYVCTKWAFEQFCARLGIPRPFARKIPVDLLLDNITRLIQEKVHNVDSTLMFHFAKFDTTNIIIGCTKEDYVYVTAEDFLTGVAAMEGNGYSFSDLLVGDRLIETDLLIDDAVITTPTTKSEFQVGVNLRSSDVGDVNPTARLMLKDISNNVVHILSTEWGRVDRIRNKKVSVQRTFVNFMGHVREMIIPTVQLEAALERIDQSEATDVQLKNWFDTFNRTIQNKGAIDEMLEWSEEQRKDTFKQIGIRRKNNTLNRLQGIPLVKDLDSGYNQRELSKIVSEYANSAVFDEREPLRRLGGNLIKF